MITFRRHHHATGVVILPAGAILWQRRHHPVSCRGYLATGIGCIFVKYPVDVVVTFILRLRQLEEEEDAEAQDDEDEDDEWIRAQRVLKEYTSPVSSFWTNIRVLRRMHHLICGKAWNTRAAVYIWSCYVLKSGCLMIIIAQRKSVLASNSSSYVLGSTKLVCRRDRLRQTRCPV